MSEVVVWDGISREFPGSPPVVALHPTDFIVRRGESHAIVGHSGSGKSTLLNLIGLLDSPTSGSYWFSGRRTDQMSEQDRTRIRLHSIAFVFQSFHLIDSRSVVENVCLPLMYRGQPLKQRSEVAVDVLGKVGLNHRVGADVSTLSGGERQRVAIARAMAGKPELLLCDEPTGNLDQKNAGVVLDLIDEIGRGGTAVITVTHSPEAASRSQFTWNLENGRFHASPSEARS